MSFSICLWKAHFVHTKWYWKIDTTTNTLNVFSIILFVSWGPCVLTPVSQGLIQRVFYVVSYFMWFNSVGQGCGDPFTGNVQRHTGRSKHERPLSALWLKWAADILVIGITVGVVCCIHHPQSSLFHCLQSLYCSHSLLFHSLYLFHVRHWQRFSIYNRSHSMFSLKVLNQISRCINTLCQLKKKKKKVLASSNI